MKRIRINITDIILISIFIFIAGSLIFSSSSSGSSNFETILSPETVNKMLIDEYNKTPLSPEFEKSTLSNIKYSVFNFISSNRVTGYFQNYFNKSNFGTPDCSTCASAYFCSLNQGYFYPVDISLKELKSKMKYDQNLLIIDVRNTDDYLKNHIPSSVNMPLLEIVNYMSTVDRWSEIVIVGDNYIQTKLASETLQRLNFHRVHRLNVPVERWDGEFESFID